MKRCSSCLELRPLEGFWRHARSPDGYQPWCKPCLRAYRWGNREAERELDRARARRVRDLAGRMWIQPELPL